MAKKNFTIIQSCFIDNRSVNPGDLVKFDLEDPKDRKTLGSLMNAGRVRENPWSESSPESPPDNPA